MTFNLTLRLSELGRLGRAGKRERYKVMPYSVMSTLYQHMLASLVRELRKSTILGEQAKQTQLLMRDSTTHTHTARLDALPMKHVPSTSLGERRHVEKDGNHGGEHGEGELIADDRELFRRAESHKAGHKKRQNGEKEELKTRIEQSCKELHLKPPYDCGIPERGIPGYWQATSVGDLRKPTYVSGWNWRGTVITAALAVAAGKERFFPPGHGEAHAKRACRKDDI